MGDVEIIISKLRIKHGLELIFFLYGNLIFPTNACIQVNIIFHMSVALLKCPGFSGTSVSKSWSSL